MTLRKRVINALSVTQEGHVTTLDNPDLRPTPVSQRKWGLKTYGLFWMGAISATQAWIATPLTSGLGVWSAVFILFPGMILSGLGLAVNGRAGAVYRIPYPVICRSCFGIYGAYWPIFCRILVTLAFSATGMATAAQLISIMITCITPKWNDIPNHMGPDSLLTSADMISFLIFTIMVAAFCLIPLPKWRFAIYGKIIIYWVTTLAMLGWVLKRTGSAGPILSYPSSVTGSKYSWTMVQFFFYFLNQSSSYISNAGDFSKSATKPRDPIIGHIICFPIANLVNTIVGFMILGSSVPLFGEAQWNPGTFLKMYLAQEYTPAGRAAMFFICLGLLLSAVVSAALENNLPGSYDIMGLAPRFINLRRAFIIVILLGWILQPWYLLGSASVFISFIVGLSNLLSSIVGVLLAHYYVVARGRLDVQMLYSKDPQGPYFYWHGINWRAFLAYIFGVAPNFYGLLGDLGVHVPLPVEHMEYFSCVMGISVAFLFYWAFSHFFPAKYALPTPKKWSEPEDDYVDPSDPAWLNGLSVVETEQQTMDADGKIQVDSKTTSVEAIP